MKKLLNKANSHLLLVLFAAIFFIQQGCKKDSPLSSTGTPVITGVRNYVASPGDSLLTSVGTGKWVVISGQNLRGALQIYFDGVKGSFNDAWFSDTSAIVLMPSVIAFPLVEPSQLNTIRYVTTHGETTFSFPIVAPPPTISGISNESANPGDTVRINGFNFFFIKHVSYAGVEVTDYTASSDGTAISMAVPASVSTPGPVIVSTKAGLATTFYNVHDYVTGVLNNYDGVNNFIWGSDVSNSSVNFPGNNGNYGVMKAASVPAGNGEWWGGGRSINTNNAQWIPATHLQDTLSNYALKFETAINKPWVNGTLQIVRDQNWDYMALYRPWRNANGTTAAFKTNGWQTVTIPLSNFLKASLPASTLTDLLGSEGKGAIKFMFINDDTKAVENFEAAIDNIRIVKVR